MKHRRGIMEQLHLLEGRHVLRGKHLVGVPQACHGNVLAELADSRRWAATGGGIRRRHADE